MKRFLPQHLAASVALSLALPAACRSTPAVHPAGTTAHAGLAGVLSDCWAHRLQHNPIEATYLGFGGYNAELALPTPEAQESRRRAVRALAARIGAISPNALNEADRLSYELAREELELAAAEFELEIDTASWAVDPLEGPQSMFLTLAPLQPAGTEEEREALLARWRKIPSYYDAVVANLRRGVANHRTASRTAITKTIQQLDEVLATPPRESPLCAAPGGSMAPKEFRDQLESIVSQSIYPAIERYRAVLRDEVLPRAQLDEHCGVSHLSGGEAYYSWCIRKHTSLDLSAAEIHAIGKREVDRIRAEISALGRSALGVADMEAIQARLRGDESMHFQSREEVEGKARDTLERARVGVEPVLGLQPKAACEVVRVPAHEERDTTIAYYRAPTTDGSRPGRYYINTFAPNTRTRYEAEVLAFHEAIPGHHTQIALAQELAGLPLVRRHGHATAYVEGWALYCERLCDELGLYTGDIDRLGMLSFDAWRACRLVVDTGMHAMGWSRQQAIDYMRENTLLAENNVENEIDRYIAWPGQALAYKLGQREILNLRSRAQVALGREFDLASFHDCVLGAGPMTLSALRRRVDSWIEASRSGSPAARGS
jgi:uncharacterized protein (DUF885 family)